MLDHVPSRIEVLIWLAEPLLRAGVRATLQFADHLIVTDCMQSLRKGPHVVVTDWSSGLQFAKRDTGSDLPVLLPSSRILVISAQVREHAVAPALRAGVHGVVRTSCTGAELVAAVRTLAEGFTYVCPELEQRIAADDSRDVLTARESEVLQLLACGRCNKIIARHLGIAVGTVKTHVKSIMAKLNAASRTEAASIAVEKGIVGMPERRNRRRAWSPAVLVGGHQAATH